MHSGSRSELSSVSMSEMGWGLLLRTPAFVALSDCVVKITEEHCTLIKEGGTAHLHAYTLSGSRCGVLEAALKLPNVSSMVTITAAVHLRGLVGI